MMYTLYSMPKSRGARVAWTLEELGLEYQYQLTRPRDACLKSLSPVQKLPVLKHDDFILIESAAICNYLADHHRTPELSPPPFSQDRAHHDAWCYFVVTDLEQPLWTYSKNSFLYPESMRVAEILDAARDEFTRSARALDSMLGDRTYLLGDRFSIADILCGHTLGWARALRFDLGTDNVKTYMKRVLARDARQRALERENLEAESNTEN